MRHAIVASASLALFVCAQVPVRAQERPWAVEATGGWAGFVDDSTKHFRVLGGSVRRYITPRVSIGPEIVVMSGGDGVTDLRVMATGNVVFDLHPATAARPRQLIPFLVAGAGAGWGRDQVRGGLYWWREGAVMAGGGVRVRLSDAMSASAEYRAGWGMYQQISGRLGYRW